MNKQQKIGCLFPVIGLVLIILGYTFVGWMNSSKDNEYIELMKSKNTFTSEEVTWLYHWRNPDKYDDHCPSKKFIELYDAKIKNNY